MKITKLFLVLLLFGFGLSFKSLANSTGEYLSTNSKSKLPYNEPGINEDHGYLDSVCTINSDYHGSGSKIFVSCKNAQGYDDVLEYDLDCPTPVWRKLPDINSDLVGMSAFKTSDGHIHIVGISGPHTILTYDTNGQETAWTSITHDWGDNNIRIVLPFDDNTGKWNFFICLQIPTSTQTGGGTWRCDIDGNNMKEVHHTGIITACSVLPSTDEKGRNSIYLGYIGGAFAEYNYYGNDGLYEPYGQIVYGPIYGLLSHVNEEGMTDNSFVDYIDKSPMIPQDTWKVGTYSFKDMKFTPRAESPQHGKWNSDWAQSLSLDNDNVITLWTDTTGIDKGSVILYKYSTQKVTELLPYPASLIRGALDLFSSIPHLYVASYKDYCNGNYFVYNYEKKVLDPIDDGQWWTFSNSYLDVIKDKDGNPQLMAAGTDSPGGIARIWLYDINNKNWQQLL